MKKLVFLFTAVLLCLSLNVQSQVFRIGDYGFTNTTSPYTPLVGDSTVTVLPSFNSGITDSIQIGFIFRFGNRIFNAFKINSNGWATFNLPTVDTTNILPITSAATVQIIAPFARDLDSAGTNNPAKVSILRSGVAPNRITKIQWQNFKSFASTIVPAIASFQVWIYETSNIVELRYGSVLAGSRTGTGNVQVGLKSGAVNIDSLRSVQGTSWPTATVSTGASKSIGPGNLPDSNRVYRFTPVPHQANDLTPTAIVPFGGVLSNCPVRCLKPRATFRNVGQLFAEYIATYQVTGPGLNYISTRSDTLSPGASRTLTFDSTLCPSDSGTLNVTVFTTFPADTNRANDTLKGTFSVANPGAGGGLASNCNYFWANNLACSPAPSKPTFGWIDTAGSTSIIIDTSSQFPIVGNKDNGYWRLAIPGPDQIRFGGIAYDSFFVTTNGMIGLTEAGNTTKLDDIPTQIPSTFAIQPGLFPLWKDFNFGTTITGSKRISFKTLTTPGEGLVLLITYDRAPNFGATLPTDYASFQVILQLTSVLDGRIIYQYEDSRTGAEFLRKFFSLAIGGLTVGIQDVSGTCGIAYRGGTNPGPIFATQVAVAFGTDQQVLPVELAVFTSTVNKRDVTLNWTTARESNNSGFDIERSPVNGDWSNVGFVQGSGTSTSSIDYSFIDRGLNTGKYNYRLKQIDFNGNFEYFNLGNEVGVGIPIKYDLSQNYPNPFNPTTKINYDLPKDGKVSIKLFDISGREVATLVNEVQPAGYYTINFNGSNLSSGAYFYRISAESDGQSANGGFVTSKKMILIK